MEVIIIPAVTSAAYIAPGVMKFLYKKTLTEILDEVCFFYNKQPDEIINTCERRKRELVVIRQIFMTIANRKYEYTHEDAANFVRKDHATSIHSCKTVSDLWRYDKSFRIKNAEILEGVPL